MLRLRYLLILILLGASVYLLMPSSVGRNLASNKTTIRSLSIGGSQSIANLVQLLVSEFESNNADIQITSLVKDQSSGKGINALIEREIDIARSSRPLKEEELKKAAATGTSLRTHRMGYDALAIVVSRQKAQDLKFLSMEQIKQLFFSEKYKTWNQLSPKLSGSIHVYVNIEAGGSGTLEVFLDKVAGDAKAKFRKDAVVVSQIAELKEKLKEDPNAIGYLSFYDVPTELQMIPIQLSSGYVSSTKPEDIRIAKYPISRELYLVTLGSSKSEALRFVEFVLSPKGQEAVARMGIIPVIGSSK